jgi:hypothetical protein
MDSQQGNWPKSPTVLARKDVLKRVEKFADYIDIVPGAKLTRPTNEERKALKNMADKLKEFAIEQSLTFKITKGDER